MPRNSSLAAADSAKHAPKVLIVDDSVVARSVLGRMVEGMRRFQLAAAVGDVSSALDYLESHRVDIVLLDIDMPGTDGLTGLPDILAIGNGAKVLIVSSCVDEGAAMTVQALALGAADTLVKPGIGAFGGRFAAVLEERLSRLMETPVGPWLDGATARIGPAAAPGDFDVVAIGASTGGIHALSQLLRAIPASFHLPILVTQHLPSSFTNYFAAQLALLGSRPCDVATDRLRVRPGRIIVAPGDAHMRVVRCTDGHSIRLSHEKWPSGCMPSVDPMFTSIAQAYGTRALGVVLSGMGRDGAEGAGHMIEAGARIVVQDRESSVIWGMPGAVAEAGQASAVLPPEEIGRFVARQGRA